MRRVLEPTQLDSLFDVLEQKGYRIIGPTVRDGAVVYDEVHATSELPKGVTDHHDKGVYRLKTRDDEKLFGFACGPRSWKQYLLPPRMRLWSANRSADGFEFEPEKSEPAKLALVGVRACELQAILIQDKIFNNHEYVDPWYQAQRERLLVIAVNCSDPGETCFCVSMNTGPMVENGFDLALTEVMADHNHYFVVEIGSEAGSAVMEVVPHRQANEEEIQTAANVLERASEKMGRQVNTADLKSLLYQNHDHPIWEQIAERCMTCSNCTMVCPTCFCTTVEDTTDLTGDRAERWRRWDSCFTTEFSYIHGGSVRSSTASRYRQWLTHKFGSWVDQFETSGCVGCGRCITWCPVGIDVTEELASIRNGKGSD